LENTDVSAVMPIKNGEKYLESAIQQLTRTLGVNDEIIVVNDASIDKTDSLLRKWARSDDRVMVINNPQPGLTNALNLGIKETSRNWIARFDVDDSYAVDRIDEQRKRIKPGVGLIFSDYDTYSPTGENLGTIPSALFASPTALSLISSQRTAHPSALFLKSAFVDAGGYKTEDFPAEDLSLWLRMIKTTEAISVPRTLLHYLIAPNSVSNTKYSSAKIKTAELLDTYKIDKRYYLDVLENFKNYNEQYKKENYGTERTILMYRDILKYSKYYKSSTNTDQVTKVFSSMIIALQQEKFLKKTFRLNSDSRKRQKLRAKL
jgi:glycosyltransferase involved in cell wall biosynthesis